MLICSRILMHRICILKMMVHEVIYVLVAVNFVSPLLEYGTPKYLSNIILEVSVRVL